MAPLESLWDQRQVKGSVLMLLNVPRGASEETAENAATKALEELVGGTVETGRDACLIEYVRLDAVETGRPRECAHCGAPDRATHHPECGRGPALADDAAEFWCGRCYGTGRKVHRASVSEREVTGPSVFYACHTCSGTGDLREIRDPVDAFVGAYLRAGHQVWDIANFLGMQDTTTGQIPLFWIVSTRTASIRALRHLREDYKVTLGALARFLDIPTPVLSRIELGSPYPFQERPMTAEVFAVIERLADLVTDVEQSDEEGTK